jgi:aminoglycoside 6'-N-acetyltransferase I
VACETVARMSERIIELRSGDEEHREQAAVLLRDSFKGRTGEWQDLDSARDEVTGSLEQEKISRVALDVHGAVVGWIGAFPTYCGQVWELHPLVVAPSRRRQGIGRALVEDLERLVASLGALTLWLGSDDENGETSASGIDLYTDTASSIRDFRRLRGTHPHEFYVRLGFRVVGVLPDANGRGRPDIFYAKRVGVS